MDFLEFLTVSEIMLYPNWPFYSISHKNDDRKFVILGLWVNTNVYLFFVFILQFVLFVISSFLKP